MTRLTPFVSVALVLLAGCSSLSTAGSSPTATQRRFVLPMHSDTVVFECAGLGYDPPIRLHGSPNEDPPAWAQWGDAKHIPVEWPTGYYAIFNPSLTVVAPSGKAVAHDGDDMSTNTSPWRGMFVCASDVRMSVYELPASSPP